MYLKMVIKWQGTTAWSRCIYTHKRTTVQTHHGCQPKVYSTHHTQSLEVHSISRSTWQTQTPRSHLHILSYQMTILLEKNEQKYPKKIANCTLCQREKAINFSHIHYRWQKYQIDLLAKLPWISNWMWNIDLLAKLPWISNWIWNIHLRQ